MQSKFAFRRMRQSRQWPAVIRSSSTNQEITCHDPGNNVDRAVLHNPTSSARAMTAIYTSPESAKYVNHVQTRCTRDKDTVKP